MLVANIRALLTRAATIANNPLDCDGVHVERWATVALAQNRTLVSSTRVVLLPKYSHPMIHRHNIVTIATHTARSQLQRLALELVLVVVCSSARLVHSGHVTTLLATFQP